MRIGLENCVIDEHRRIALISCAEIYTHVTKNGLQKIPSLLDALDEEDEI